MPTPLSLSLALQPPSSLHNATPFSTNHSNQSSNSLSISNGGGSIGRRTGSGRSPISEFASRTLRSPFSTPVSSSPASSPTLRPQQYHHQQQQHQQQQQYEQHQHQRPTASTPLAANNNSSSHGLRRTVKRVSPTDSDSHSTAASTTPTTTNPKTNIRASSSPLSATSSPSTLPAAAAPSSSICLQPTASTSTTTNVVITATTSSSTTSTPNSTSPAFPNASKSPTTSVDQTSAATTTTTTTKEQATGVFWKALAHAKNSIAFTSQAAIRLDTMTDYWHQFHLWHREESPLVDTEYDLDRERQRIMQQQQQQQHQNCEAVPHYHHHHHHPTHPVYSPAVKRHQASSQGMPVVARTSSGQPMAPSSPSPRRRTSLQSPRIPMAANNAHSRELPRSTQDLSRLLESVFDDATAHAQMSHSRTHHSSSDCGRDRDLDNSDDDDDGPLCMRTPVARRLAAHSAKLSSPSGPTMNVLKSAAPMSPKEMTLSQPPTLPLSSLPRSSISVRSLHASAAVTQSTTPSPAPAPKVTSRPKFFVSDDSEDEDEDDFEDEDNEEDILVANYRKLSETIAHGRQHRQPQPQHRIPSLRVDKAGNEGDDECEDDDIVDDMATLTSASKKQQQQQQHLNPNNHPLVAERRQSLLSDLLMAEKMANLAAKKSNDECSMANASPMPARFTTLKQVPYNNNNNHYNYHFGSRTMAHHGSNQSSRCHSAANSDGESQLYPTLVVNGATPGCRKETPIIMMQDGRRVTCPSSSSSSEEEEDTHRHNNRHRSPLMRTRKSLFNKLDELVKATEAEEERMALEADLAKQRISHEKDMKDILEESEDCFGPHAIMQNEREKKDADFGVVATSQSPRSAAPVTSQSPQGQQQQQPQAQEARSSAPGIGGWSRSSVQYQIQSLYGMSASTVQRALSTATATLAEYGYLGSRSSSTTPEATQPATPATQKEHQRQSSHQSSLSPPPKQQPQGRLSAAANLLQKHLSSH